MDTEVTLQWTRRDQNSENHKTLFLSFETKFKFFCLKNLAKTGFNGIKMFKILTKVTEENKPNKESKQMRFSQ